MNITKRIPGFRSGKWWKILIASGFYLLVVLMISAILFPPAPTLALDKIDLTNKTSVSISGKTYGDKEVYLLENNQQIQLVKADSKGKFYFPINDLKDGNYTYTVQVCKSEKKDKCRTENILLVVDQTPPAKPAIVLPTNLPNDSEEEITIKGVTEPNAKVIAQISQCGTSQEAYANDKGEFEVKTGLVLGANTISVKAIDNADNESETITSAINFNPTKYKAKVARVVDGDTIKLETGEVVRYIGIDTPETVHPNKPVQCYGKEASDKNKELVEGKEIKLEKDVSETDKYDRLLRYVWLGDMLVNEYLVREGYAQSSSYPPDVKYQNKFIEAQRLAREENKGLWGDICEVVISPTPKTNQTQTTILNTPTTSTQTQQTTQPISGSFTCNCSKTCAQMSSCEEAQYQLDVCGCKARDADKDGIACDSDCQ